MPYNSAAFERQLAKFKQEQAKKAGLVEEQPEDAHKAKARIEVGRGTVTPNLSAPPEASVPESTPEPETIVIVQQAPKKPFYKQGWFIFLLFSTVISGAMPLVMKGQMDDMWGMANTVNSTAGVDIFSPETYKKMFAQPAPVQTSSAYAPQNEQPATKASAENRLGSIVSTVAKQKAAIARKLGAAPEAEAAAQDPTSTQEAPSTTKLQTATDIHQMVDMAAEKAAEVTAGGTENSMKYIEEESKRLQKMAEEFDKTYGEPK